MSPGAFVERPGVCLLGVGAVALVLLAGCVGDSDVAPTTADEPGNRLGLVYEAEGPLYVPGFWPPAEGDPIVAEEGDWLNVTVTPGEVVVDARGVGVPAVNVTYTFDEQRATHWVHPKTGQIIVVEQRGFLDIPTWRWGPSGMEALLGQFDALAAGETPQSFLTVECCERDKVFAPPMEEPLNLTLESTQGSLAWLDTTDGAEWTPPAPREVPEHDWPGRHAPAGDGQDLAFDLSDAVATATERCPETADYMDQHPGWQAVHGTFLRNPGLAPFATEEHRWELVVEGDADTARVATARSQRPASPAPDPGPSVDTCTSNETEAFGLWQRPGEPRTMGYTDAWMNLRATVEPDEEIWRSTSIVNRSGGPLFTGAIFFDPYESPTDAVDLEARSLEMDLETGLLWFYAARNPPGEEIEHPLGQTGAAETADQPAPHARGLEGTVAVCSLGLPGASTPDRQVREPVAASGCAVHRSP